MIEIGASTLRVDFYACAEQIHKTNASFYFILFFQITDSLFLSFMDKVGMLK
jgi:hypothetical protein